MKKLLLSLALLLPFLATAETASWKLVGSTGSISTSGSAGSWNPSVTNDVKKNYGGVGLGSKGNSWTGKLTLSGSEIPANATINKLILNCNGGAKNITFNWDIYVNDIKASNSGTMTSITAPASTSNLNDQNITVDVNLIGNNIAIDFANNAGAHQFIIWNISVDYTVAPVGPQAPVLAFVPATVELKEGEIVALSDVTTLSGVPEGATVVYKSADEEIAAIVDGELKAMGEGETTITATTSETDDYLEGTAELKVVVKSNKQDPQLSFAQNEVNVFVGDEEFEGLTVSCAEGVKVVYSSDNEDVAMVDENNGFVIIGAAGTATITATSSADDTYYSATASYVINVNKHDADLSFNETAVEKYFNSTEYGEFPVLNNPNNLVVTYASSKPEVATVEDGVITILADGTTTITATSAATDAYNAGEASYTLTVTDASISSKYVLVKDIAQIENGSKVLIVNAAKGKTLINNPSGNNFKTTDVKIENEEINSLPDNAAIIEVEAIEDATATKFAFKVSNLATDNKDNTYLTPSTNTDKTAKENHLKLTATQTLAEVTIGDNFNANIEFTDVNVTGRNTIFYNTGNSLFACYQQKSTAVDYVQLYVQPGVAAPAIDHIITYRFDDGRFEINFEVDNEEAAIYYNIQKADAPARVIAADGKDYIRHDGNTFIVDDGDTVSYYAEHKGVKSEIKTVLANTTTTGIEAIEAEGEGAARYFNLQGVEVAQPAAGQVYIKVINGKAAKVVK